jgi:outer membrane protein
MTFLLLSPRWKDQVPVDARPPPLLHRCDGERKSRKPFDLDQSQRRPTSGCSLSEPDVGSVWVLPPTLTLQYHFFPQERFSPYIGAGINASVFYSVHAVGSVVNQVAFSNNVGAAIQADVDYNIGGHWFANLDVKQIFLNTTASINHGVIKASTALNPLVVGVGIGYRF